MLRATPGNNGNSFESRLMVFEKITFRSLPRSGK